MELWEFLIQKEGDRSWLPLESPNVEILEGRYRVVAHANRANIPIQIRVSHLATTEDPPKRRTQKRMGKINADGLVVVIPYTRLLPGVWELSCCSSDVMSDFMGDSWRYAVKLQVIPQTDSPSDHWDSDWQSDDLAASDVEAASRDVSEKSTIAPIRSTGVGLTGVKPAIEPVLSEPAIQEIALPTTAVELARQVTEQAAHSESPVATPTDLDEAIANLPIFQEAKQQSEQVIADLFQELDETIGKFWEPEQPPELPALTPQDDDLKLSAPLQPGQVQLVLNQEIFITRQEQAITVSGTITSIEIPTTTSITEVPATTLRIRLSDPQTVQVITETIHALAAQPLPAHFDVTVPIPEQSQTCLLLGEIALIDVLPDLEQSTVLAIQSFHVTIDIPELLEAIASPPAKPVPVPGEKDDQSQNHLDGEVTARNLDLESTPANVRSRSSPPLDLTFLEFVQPAKSPSLSAEGDHQDIPTDLNPPQPPVSPSEDEASAGSVETIEETSDSLSAEPPPVAIEPVIHPDPTVEPAIAGPQAPQAATMLDQAEPKTEAAGDADPPKSGLQERFWSRLNALATDANASHEMPVPEAFLSNNQSFLGLDADLVAQEIVVEDDPPPPIIGWGGIYQPKRQPMTAEETIILPEDEPVPVPQLEFSAHELVSGQSIFVTVKLPYLKPRMYVKLWIQDRQTRSLLDGPHLFVAFVPDHTEQLLETRAQLTIPYGCLEVQFEAIAVEMATQRESHKVTIDRQVIPPDLPAFTLDDLNV
jgi:hypothetical protein